MRGNENEAVPVVLVVVTMFPIPMRGNEIIQSAAESGSAEVPDPHEG